MWSLLVLIATYTRVASCETPFYYVKHSMTREVPHCHKDAIMMWVGYSYMGPDNDNDIHGREACQSEFTTAPIQWDYLNPHKFSYWLGTGLNIDATNPIAGKDIHPLISRCIVCQVDNAIKTRHAAKRQLLGKCGKGWKELWSGYTYLKPNETSESDKQKHLSTHASCLPGIRPNPLIKCDMVKDKCWSDTQTTKYWSIEGKHEDSLEMLPLHSMKKRAGRCLVCFKDGYYEGEDHEIKSKVDENGKEKEEEDVEKKYENADKDIKRNVGEEKGHEKESEKEANDQKDTKSKNESMKPDDSKMKQEGTIKAEKQRTDSKAKPTNNANAKESNKGEKKKEKKEDWISAMDKFMTKLDNHRDEL